MAAPPTHTEPPTYTRSTTLLPLTPDALHEFMLDVNNIVHMHPLLVDIQATQEPTKVEGQDSLLTASYNFTDEMTHFCGLYRKRFQYTGQVWYKPGPGQRLILYRALAGPGVIVEHEQEVVQPQEGEGEGRQASGSGSLLVQRTWIQAPWLLKAYVISSAREAHTEMLRKLGEYLNQQQHAAETAPKVAVPATDST